LIQPSAVSLSKRGWANLQNGLRASLMRPASQSLMADR